MQKNSQDFSMQEALRLANSPAGQQLLAMLRSAGRLEQAGQQARTGNYAQALAGIEDILSTPEGKKLLKELGK